MTNTWSKIAVVVTCVFVLLLSSLNLVSAQGSNEAIKFLFEKVSVLNYPNVEIDLNVFDSRGVPITGLGNSNFNLTLEGRPLTNFTLTETLDTKTPLSIVLLIDASGSMVDSYPNALVNAIDSATVFIDRLSPADCVAVVSFNDDVIVHQGLTSEKSLAIEALGKIHALGQTALNDALIVGSQLLANSTGRKAIVLLTDGADSGVSKVTIDEAVTFAISKNITVFPVGMGIEDPRYIEDIVARTGGFSQSLDDPSQAVEALNSIINILRYKYTLRFDALAPKDQRDQKLDLAMHYLGNDYQAHLSFSAEPLKIFDVTPFDGAVLAKQTQLSFTTESSEDIAKINLYLDGQLIHEFTREPYTFLWDLRNVSIGNHEFLIEGFDVLGNQTIVKHNFTLREPVQVTITAPGDRELLLADTQVQMTVDSIAPLKQLSLLLDGNCWFVKHIGQ